MATVRALVQLEAASGLPEDAVVNNFYFETPAAPTDLANIRDMLVDFYTTNPTGIGTAVQDFLSPLLSGDATIRIYDLADPEPRVPIAGYAFTIAVAGNALPREVALCVSFQAAGASGQPQARRRGRVYIGPLDQTGLDFATGRPNASIIEVFSKAARDLLAASAASITWDWVVFSGVDGVGRDVISGWVDNAWDTQRRRGDASSTRQLWTSSTPA